jgi:hypothetical protein
MIEIVEFIKENFKVIIIIVIVLLFLLVLINIKGLNLNEKKIESKLVQKVTVETFGSTIDLTSASIIDTNLDKIMGKTNTFCESYLENSGELEKACEQLTKSNCANVKCCVFNNGKCAAGDINGPTYKTDKDGNLITMDSYYYLGKKMSHTM